MSRPHVRVDLRRELPFLLLVNGVIATLVTLLAEGEHFGFNLLVSNCIGFLMWGGTSLLCYALKVERVAFWHVLACMPLAVVLGFTLASSLWPGVVPERIAGTADLALQLRKFAMMALVTISAASLFYYRYNHQRNLTLLADAGRRQAELQQAETAARLALLQAQIEPHFLFNTLATLRSLIGSDPARATQALDLLNDYLRASLSRTRRREVTLADELALVTPLLALAQLRMGEARLQYRIDVAERWLGLPLPPLLLQPLVENALQHGLEPAVAGGSLLIEAIEQPGRLCLRVSDSGLGLEGSHGSSSGVGLANVRQRLHALYGERAALSLYARQPHGVVAELSLPLEEPQA